jgi:hypothetical protein
VSVFWLQPIVEIAIIERPRVNRNILKSTVFPLEAVREHRSKRRHQKSSTNDFAPVSRIIL